jgi:hypothetical protein
MLLRAQLCPDGLFRAASRYSQDDVHPHFESAFR